MFRFAKLTLVLASVCGVAVAADVKPCANGTVANYLGSSCSQGAAVTTWLTYSCTSTPDSICAALGANGSNVNIRMDPQGPYTFLVGKTTLWNVKAGQKVDVVIGGTVYGARGNGNWPHFERMKGQTGDGTEENITTVDCGTNCLDANKGVSDVLCSATSPAETCVDQRKPGPYVKYQTQFQAAPPEHPYPFTIEIKLNGGNHGTATLYSLGAHLGPMVKTKQVP
jgi:hypothetical protein